MIEMKTKTPLMEKIKKANDVMELDSIISDSLDEAIGDDAPYLHYNKYGNDEDYGYASAWTHISRLLSDDKIKQYPLNMELLNSLGLSNEEIQDLIYRGLLVMDTKGGLRLVK